MIRAAHPASWWPVGSSAMRTGDGAPARVRARSGASRRATFPSDTSTAARSVRAPPSRRRPANGARAAHRPPVPDTPRSPGPRAPPSGRGAAASPRCRTNSPSRPRHVDRPVSGDSQPAASSTASSSRSPNGPSARRPHPRAPSRLTLPEHVHGLVALAVRLVDVQQPHDRLVVEPPGRAVGVRPPQLRRRRDMRWMRRIVGRPRTRPFPARTVRRPPPSPPGRASPRNVTPSAASARTRSSTPSLDASSSSAVGSSATMMPAPVVIAWANAARCCSPPDSSEGRWSIRSPMPRQFEQPAPDRARPEPRPRPARRRCSPTVRCARKLSEDVDRCSRRGRDGAVAGPSPIRDRRRALPRRANPSSAGPCRRSVAAGTTSRFRTAPRSPSRHLEGTGTSRRGARAPRRSACGTRVRCRRSERPRRQSTTRSTSPRRTPRAARAASQPPTTATTARAPAAATTTAKGTTVIGPGGIVGSGSRYGITIAAPIKPVTAPTHEPAEEQHGQLGHERAAHGPRLEPHPLGERHRDDPRPLSRL